MTDDGDEKQEDTSTGDTSRQEVEASIFSVYILNFKTVMNLEIYIIHTHNLVSVS